MIVQMNFDRISVTIVIFSVFSPKKKLQRLLIPFKTIFASEKKAFLDYLWCNFSVLVSIDVYTVLEVIVHFFSFYQMPSTVWWIQVRAEDLFCQSQIWRYVCAFLAYVLSLLKDSEEKDKWQTSCDDINHYKDKRNS